MVSMEVPPVDDCGTTQPPRCGHHNTGRNPPSRKEKHVSVLPHVTGRDAPFRAGGRQASGLASLSVKVPPMAQQTDDDKRAPL
jgi:hypothetical protein